MHYLVFGNHQSQSYIFKKSQRYFWTLTFSNILKCIRPSVAYCSPTWWLTSNINNTSEPGPWIHHSMATGIEAVVFITLLTYCVHVEETKVTADKKMSRRHSHCVMWWTYIWRTDCPTLHHEILYIHFQENCKKPRMKSIIHHSVQWASVELCSVFSQSEPQLSSQSLTLASLSILQHKKKKKIR